MDHSLVIIFLLLLNLGVGIISIHDKQFFRTGIKKLKDCLEKRKCSLSDKSTALINDRKIDLVEKDLIRNTTALAKGGKAFAQCLLGKMFQNGMGVTSDKDQAIHWYEKAALQGHSKPNIYLLNVSSRAAVARLEFMMLNLSCVYLLVAARLKRKWN